jgi:hypothetical protein
MTVLRNVLTDLVDKKLWPVAVALLVALAAIPFVLGGGETAPAPLPVGSAAGEKAPDVVVTPAEDTPRGGADRPANDPFRARPGQATADATGAVPATGVAPTGTVPTGTGTGVAAPAGGSGDTGTIDIPGLDDIGVVPVGGSTGGSTGGSGSNGSGSDDSTKTSDDKDSWHVDLRFGKNGSVEGKNDVPRLTPLPSAEDPFFVFLGVAADGKTALFLVSSDAEATGDGKCIPTPANCDRVEMQAGDTEFFDVATPEGEVVQYQLDLVKIARKTSANAAVAQSARARQSTAGRKALRTAIDTKQVDVSDLAYSSDLGLVVPSGQASSVGGALFGGFRVDLRFGAPGALVKRYNLARLTPLPSVEEPTFVYLGVLGDGETAIFLNPSEAHASGGEAVCEPSPEQCQRVKLGAGQSATFDAPTLDGGTTQYQLDIDGITPLEAATPEEAEASRKRESPAGRVILRRLVHEVGGLVEDLTFSGGTGVVEEGAKTAE